MRRHAVWLLALTACAGTGGDAPAGVARCTECDIELRRVGVLSDSTDAGALPDVMVYASRDRHGRLFTLTRRSDAVLVFAADGSLLRTLGTPGDGPGEFRNIRRVFHGPGDSIYVADWRRRMTVFAPDLSFVRTQSISHQLLLVLNDWRMLVGEQAGDAGRVGFPFRVVDADGTVIRSFGTDTAHTGDAPLFSDRLAALTRGGDIWTIAKGRYVLDRWNPATGEHAQSITIDSPWFKDLASWPDDERVRPPAVIECIWEDDDGVVWVMARAADLDWKPPARANVERPIDPEEYSQRFDWILEAIDPRAGVVIASKRFRDVLWARPPSNVVVSESGSGSGGAAFDAWQPVLVPRGQ